MLIACDPQYHLPACLRLLEAAHIPEILREAGPRGLHVEEIARRVGEVRRGISTSSGSSHAPEGAGDIRSDEGTGNSDKSSQRAGDRVDGESSLDPSLLSASYLLSLSSMYVAEVRAFAFNRSCHATACDAPYY